MKKMFLPFTGLFAALILLAFATASHAGPVVTAISPTNGPTVGGTVVTVTGSGFPTITNNVSVYLSYQATAMACAVTSVKTNVITCVTPAWQGQNLSFVVDVDGTSSNFAFSYFPPTITSISPWNGSSTGNFPLSITGTNFGLGGTVTLGGVACAVTFWGQTNILVTCPEGDGSSLTLTVTPSNSAAATLTGFNYQDVPTISSVWPTNGSTAGGETLTINGTGFGLAVGSVALNNITCLIQRWNTNSIEAQCPAGQGADLPLTLITDTGNTTNLADAFSYFPPGVVSWSPSLGSTAGGFQLTIAGTNFGLPAGTLTMGGVVCSNVSWGQTQIIVDAAPGEGANVPLVVTTSGGRSCPTVYYSYGAPALTSILPSIYPTTGGTATLRGSNLGSNGIIYVGTNVVSSWTSWSSSNIVFSLPPGQGMNLPVSVITGGQSASNLFISYDPPAISSVTPAHGPTAGGTMVTLIGSNFGTTSATLMVTLGGNSCSNVSWTQTNISCATPPGNGTQLFQVGVNNESSTSRIAFNYDPPVIASVNPLSGPTAGGTPMTITGSNFYPGDVLVTVGAASCTNILISATQIVCSVPQGYGVGKPIQVTVAGQTTTTANAFSYFPPTITAVVPNHGPTAGGYTVNVVGSNLSPQSVSVMLNNSICSVGQGSATFTNVHVTIPAGTGVNLPVSVTVGGQASATTIPFSYDPPVITSVTPSNGLVVGGDMIIRGTNFGTSGTVVLGNAVCSPTQSGYTDYSITVTIPQGQGTNLTLGVDVGQQTTSITGLSYAAPVVNSCSPTDGPATGQTVVTVNGANFGTSGILMLGGVACPSSVWSPTTIQFATPAGTGAKLPITVTVSGQMSAGNVFFSYDPPTILSVAPNFAPPTGGVPITVSGANFGASPSIFINGALCTNTLVQTNQVTCIVPPGQGQQLPVAVYTGAQTFTLTNGFSYIGGIITGMNPSNGPTMGGTLVAVTGENFGSNGYVTLAGTSCLVSNWSETNVLFVTPAGQGSNVTLAFSSTAGASISSGFSYSPPKFNSLSPVDGPTAGGNIVAIAGSNFSASGILLFAGQVCSNVIWSDSGINFVAPPGAGTNSIITISAGNQMTVIPFAYFYDVPQILSVSPGALPTQSGSSFTIYGTNFGTSGEVLLGGQMCATTYWSESEIHAKSPEFLGPNEPLNVIVGGQTSPSYAVTAQPPRTSYLAPSNGLAQAETEVTIYGTNLGTSGLLTVGGIPCGVLSWSDSEISAITPALTGSNLIVLLQTATGFATNIGTFSYFTTNTLCLPGTYSATGLQPGVPAPPGYFVPGPGATNPIPADAGYFAQGYGNTNPTAASAGSYTPIAGMRSALSADPGFYVSNSGSTLQTATSPGYIQPEPGQTGQISARPGHYAPVARMISDILASPGFYVPSNGYSYQIPASPGYYVPASGSLHQSPAGSGFYAPVSNMTSELPAPAGFYVPSNGATMAMRVDAGYYQPNAGQANELLTQVGSYAPLSGMMTGILASPGYYVPLTGMTNQIPAGPGFYVPSNGASAQMPSLAGNYVPGSNMSIALPAPIGTYVPSNAAVAPTLADPGYFQNDVGQTSQKLVPLGRYTPFAGMSAGIDSSPGYYVSQTGSSNQTPASPGYFVSSKGAIMQSSALPGTYAPIGAMIQSLQAPPGTYANATNATNATRVDPGFVQSSAGQGGEMEVPAGYYAPVGGMVTGIPASPGYYVPDSGMTNQVPASPGYYVPLYAAFAQRSTPPGFYTPSSNMSQALPAPVGTYISGSNATSPTPTSPGYYSSAEGQTNQSPTPPGYYAPSYYSFAGISASPGYYVPGSNAAAQMPAPVGFYSPGYNATNATLDPSGTFTPISGMAGYITLGDANNDGIVSQSELDAVLSNYWMNSPWVTMNDAQSMGRGIFQFSLTNETGWDFSVLSTSNLSSTNWTYMTNAYPVYQFVNTNTNASQLFYKLRYP